MKIYKTKSEKETLELGRRLAETMRGGEVVALRGDLGAGKTVLARGIARGLGIKKPITSPTFVLMKIYPVKGHGKIKNLVHVDAYRLEGGASAETIGIADYVGRADTVCLIEWAKRIKDCLPKNIWQVDLKAGETEDERVVEVKK